MTSTDPMSTTNPEASAPGSTTEPKPRSKGPTITLAICLAAGVAAGIGLARPGNPSTGTPPNAAAGTQAAADAPSAGTGYGAETPAPADADGGQVAAAPAAQAGAIDIAGFAFGDPITVGAGSTITVTNLDGAAHTLTSNDGLFDTGSLAGGSATDIGAPGQPGTYSFFCSIHPSMQGTVTVTG